MEQPRVLAEDKYPELNKLIQTGKDRGFIMYEELFEQLPEEVTGIAEKLDDIYIRLGELEIDVVEADSVEPEDKDDKLHVVEDLSRGDEMGWTQIDDTTWEFTLREGVTFHDGSAFDAADVKASIELASGAQLRPVAVGILHPA